MNYFQKLSVSVMDGVGGLLTVYLALHSGVVVRNSITMVRGSLTSQNYNKENNQSPLEKKKIFLTHKKQRKNCLSTLSKSYSHCIVL